MRVQVMDGRIVATRQVDELLTTKARLTAEPNDALPLGALGVVYSGEFLGGKVPEQQDLKAMMVKVATDPSLLSTAERAHIATIVAKFSGRTAGPVSGAGVVSNDAATHWAAESARKVAAGVAHVAYVQKTYSDYWDKHTKAMAGNV